MKLYQAEWCPFSHCVRAKLTELGIDYETVNVPAATKNRDELEEVVGTRAIPVLVDGERVITDSGEAITYLEERHAADPEELKVHRRELSPTVYCTIQRGAISQVPIHRLRAGLDQGLGRRGATFLGQLFRWRVATHKDTYLPTLLQQLPRDHAADDPRSADYHDHS
jgi:glutaredoxin 3